MQTEFDSYTAARQVQKTENKQQTTNTVPVLKRFLIERFGSFINGLAFVRDMSG